MSSYQQAPLPPLSSIASVAHDSDNTSGPGIGGFHTSGMPNATSSTDYREPGLNDTVPKKLKGRGNDLNSFAMMQMDLTHEQPLDRDEVAKRTSESSEQAAMRAYQGNYSTPSSNAKRFIRVPDDDAGSWDQYASAPAPGHISSSDTSPGVTQIARSHPLSLAEAKTEQARLLAHLRTLTPSSIADRVYKALAYFGGPDGIPLTQNTFRGSDLANGHGSALIGWLAELFPSANTETSFSRLAQQPSSTSGLPSLAADGLRSRSTKSTEQTSNANGNSQLGSDGTPQEKRRRGRPKGSKATKVRRDKGIKKGPLKARQGAMDESAQPGRDLHALRNIGTEGAADDSWADVDDDHILDPVGDSSLFFPPSADRSQAPNTAVNGHVSGGVDGSGLGQDAPQNLTENGKKRGRPKGSKNKPKQVVTDDTGDKAGGTTGAPKKSNIGRPKGSTSKRTEKPSQPTNDDSAYDISNIDGTGQDAPMASGAKRKRPKAIKQEGPMPDGQPSESHGPTTKKQRKVADALAPTQDTSENISPVAETLVNPSTSGMGANGPSLGSDDQMMPSLDTSSASAGDFAFETLSHLSQGTPTSLTSHHQHDHDQAMSSLRQQVPQQHRQQPQQQSIVAQKTMASTPPFHGAESLQSMQGAGRHQQHISQGGNTHQSNALPQLSTQNIPPAVSQHSAQTQMTASLSSGSLPGQQLPRPSRTPQPSFYAQSRSGGNGQFGQTLPQPQQQQPQAQQHHHHQQDQQSHQKQQFASQYQTQSYSSQPQQQQQTFAPQPPRHPSQGMGSSSPGLLNHNSTHRSPIFGAPAPTGLRNVTGAYGTTPSTGAMGFSSPAYEQARRPNPAGSPSIGSGYAPPGAGPHAMGHHQSPPFTTSRPQHSPSASHAPNVGGPGASMQGFHGFDGSTIFDNMGLDPNTNGSGGLGLQSATAYNLGGGVSRASTNAGGFGPQPPMNSFDASISGNMRDRFFMRR